MFNRSTKSARIEKRTTENEHAQVHFTYSIFNDNELQTLHVTNKGMHKKIKH